MSNLILGAVVENFSYVFQIYGKVRTINREQMRGYKRVWQQFDPERTGFMQKKDIVPFLGVRGSFPILGSTDSPLLREETHGRFRSQDLPHGASAARALGGDHRRSGRGRPANVSGVAGAPGRAHGRPRQTQARDQRDRLC